VRLVVVTEGTTTKMTSAEITAAEMSAADMTTMDRMAADLTAMEQFDLRVFLDRLDQLHPKVVGRIPTSELEWILAAFVLSWGQRLPLAPETWPPVAERESLRKFSNIYFPFAVAPDFPVVSTAQIRKLAFAWAALDLHVLLLDYVINRPVTAPAAVKLALPHLMLHVHRLLSELFPPNAPFWREMERCRGLMSRSMLDECQMYGGMARPFPLDEFKRIACGKMALARLNYISLAMLNGTPEHIPTLNQCWDAIGLAVIIYDDVLDWREDYENANYTYLLSQVLFSSPFRVEVEAGQLPEPAEVGATLFCTDLVESLYMLAAKELKLAAEQARGIDCPALANLITQLEAKMAAWSTDMFDQKMAALIAMNTSRV
jgi:hypothetical protein